MSEPLKLTDEVLVAVDRIMGGSDYGPGDFGLSGVCYDDIVAAIRALRDRAKAVVEAHDITSDGPHGRGFAYANRLQSVYALREVLP